MPSTSSFPNTKSTQIFLICGRQEHTRSSPSFVQGLFFDFLIRWRLVHLSAAFSSLQTADSSLGGHPVQVYTARKCLSCAECYTGATVHQVISVQSCFTWNWNQVLINGHSSQVSEHPLDNLLISPLCCCCPPCSQRSPQSLALQFDSIICCSTSTKAALGMVTDDTDVFASYMLHSNTTSYQFIQTKYP